MTKKKKIIIASICLAVILLGTVIGIIIATWKRFDITPNYEVIYNDHTSMEIVSLPQGYSSKSTKYSNATVVAENSADGKWGIYSYVENELLVPAKYANGEIDVIDILDTNGELVENVFVATGDNGEIDYYNDKGNKLSITEFDEQNYGYIKERELDLSEKRAGVKVRTKNEFHNKKIAINSIEFNTAYVRDGVYHYETWTLTDTNGQKYINLYKVCNGNRVLIQTLNNSVGSDIETALVDINSTTHLTTITALNDLEPLYFLKDGTPMILQSSLAQINSNSTGKIELSVYNINFDKESSTQVTIDENLHNAFRVGDSLYFQYKIPANEKKYEFSETTTSSSITTTNYYNLETYRFNLKTGNYSKIAFDYLVEDYNADFNVETILVHAREIKNKLLNSEELLLINDRLQTKKMDYEFEYLTKISDDNYIAHSSSGVYLINKNYEKIAFLGKYDNIFTTKDAVMLSSNTTGFTYVCDMKGTIIKKYYNSEITNIYDDTYYMITTEREENGVRYIEKYLERLGVRQKTPIYSKAIGSDEYTFNDDTYVAYSDSVVRDGISIITRVKKIADNNYTCELYNMKGKLLRVIPNFETSNLTLTYYDYSDEDHILAYLSTNVGGVGYTILLDR